MKESFQKAKALFKYVFLLFTILFFILLIIDEWNRIQQYWSTHFLEGIGLLYGFS